MREPRRCAKTVAADFPPSFPAQDTGPRVENLDEIDLKILSEIQADGRITNVELAKRVGISPPPCLRRVRTLEEEGYIQGYRGLLDPRRLGFDVTVFASVHLSSQADADLRAFEEFVRAEPLVRECWMLSGEVDFILKCVAPDMATFQDFVTHLTAAPHVRNVRTSLVLHNSKYEAAVPLESEISGKRATVAPPMLPCRLIFTPARSVAHEPALR